MKVGMKPLPHVMRMAFRFLLIERHVFLVTNVGILTGVGNSVRMERRSIERNHSRIEETDVGRQFALGCERKLEHISDITDVSRTPIIRHVAFVTREDSLPQTHRFETLLDSPGKLVTAFATLYYMGAPSLTNFGFRGAAPEYPDNQDERGRRDPSRVDNSSKRGENQRFHKIERGGKVE